MSDLPEKLSFVDIETTGGSLYHDRIIEVGIVRVENNQVVKTFKTLLNPELPIPPEITQLTGIHSHEVENAPIFYRVKDELEELLHDAVFVAHNARFDYGFLRSEFKRVGVSFKAKQLCTCKLSRKLFPRFRRHNLDAIIDRFGFTCEARHRAFGDAQVLWDFYQLLLKQIKPEKFAAACKQLLKRPSVPINISQKILDDLPESPGVYIFYGDDGMPLYVGKSVNIRDRVLSHFASDHASTFELKITQQVKSIETVSTVGELGAFITESALIKKLQPLYNKKLRHAYDLVVLHRITNNFGYDTVAWEQMTDFDLSQLPDVLGVFRSKKQAQNALVELAKEHQLCQKLLGVEHGKGNCFGYGLNWCKGACARKEIPAFYNARFTLAFSRYKIKRWPFGSAVVIQERDEDGNTETHIIDNWCYLGKETTRADGDEVSDSQEISFDYDLYKILERFLRNERNLRQVSILSKKISHLPNSPVLMV